jgi:ppGpp synthetase/RelA/SpoT-type nucleotidyltranferase
VAQVFSLNWLQSDLQKVTAGRDVDEERILQALQTAYHFHAGQFRENGLNQDKIPYITHPVGVAKIAIEEFSNNALSDTLTDIVCAALMHDLLEDTMIETSEMERASNARVLELVSALTKPNSSKFESRSERNSSFIKKIEDSGPSAKYLKVCDALHNLSRPASMPLSLLKKTIGKAKRDYLPLSLDPVLSVSLRERLEKAIGAAEMFSQESDLVVHSHSTADSYLSYCIDRSSGKVLELHDVQDILLELDGISLIYTGGVAEFTAKFLAGLFDEQTQGDASKLEQTMSDKGVLVLSGRPFATSKVKELSFQEVRSLPLGSTLGPQSEMTWMFLGLDRSKAPAWLTQPFLRAVVSILSERNKEQQTKLLIDYTEWLSAAGLDINPRVAATLSLSRHSILEIAQIRKAASIELGSIESAVSVMLDANDQPYFSLGSSSRVKSATSIAMKLAKLSKQSVFDLEDLMGVRIVMLNKTSVSAFAQTLKCAMLAPESVWAKDIGVIAESIELREIETVSGYRATHILFRTRTAYVEPQTVACEIQIRTAFEDLWAQIAHDLAYKTEAKVGKKSKRTLKELAEVCREADGITDRF